MALSERKMGQAKDLERSRTSPPDMFEVMSYLVHGQMSKTWTYSSTYLSSSRIGKTLQVVEMKGSSLLHYLLGHSTTRDAMLAARNDILIKCAAERDATSVMQLLHEGATVADPDCAFIIRTLLEVLAETTHTIHYQQYGPGPTPPDVDD
jgi:hypothetical protein